MRILIDDCEVRECNVFTVTPVFFEEKITGIYVYSDLFDEEETQIGEIDMSKYSSPEQALENSKMFIAKLFTVGSVKLNELKGLVLY